MLNILISPLYKIYILSIGPKQIIATYFSTLTSPLNFFPLPFPPLVRTMMLHYSKDQPLVSNDNLKILASLFNIKTPITSQGFDVSNFEDKKKQELMEKLENKVWRPTVYVQRFDGGLPSIHHRPWVFTMKDSLIEVRYGLVMTVAGGKKINLIKDKASSYHIEKALKFLAKTLPTPASTTSTASSSPEK